MIGIGATDIFINRGAHNANVSLELLAKCRVVRNAASVRIHWCKQR